MDHDLGRGRGDAAARRRLGHGQADQLEVLDQAPALDPKLGLLYFTTGNPGPDLRGDVRPGNNLFGESMVCLDARTGRRIWHSQHVHHDMWDWDNPAAHHPEWPVETRYAGSNAPLLPGPGAGESVEALTTRIVRRALGEEPGDVLVFLPGAREIRRVQSQLQGVA